MTERETKRVRAYNVHVGDELHWWDMKARREATMVVRSVDSDSFPGVQQLVLRRGPRGTVDYRWNMKSTDLVRVRRVP